MFPVLGVPMGGGGNPINTLAPAIAAAAVIGTTITPTPGTWIPGTPALTYQWQRYSGGAWGDIAGATTADRAPVDADFGYALRLTEIATNAAGSTVAYSNETNLVIEVPAQTFGNEKVLNGNFASADNWTASGGCSISGGVAVFNGTSSTLRQNISAVATERYEFVYEVVANTSGNLYLSSVGFTDVSQALNVGTGVHRWILRAVNTDDLYLTGTGSPPWTGQLDNLSVKKNTPNVQLVAPSANMRLDFKYTLPGSPVEGTLVWILPRIDDFAAGNNWRGVIQYTGAQWNINLYSVAENAATSRISAVNIGATNRVRTNMKDDAIGLYTSADGGSNFTQRGSTISNATYQTATGANALWTADVTPDQLIYAAAD
jgi:hypothetical protein